MFIIDENKKIYCCGKNQYGELGFATFNKEEWFRENNTGHNNVKDILLGNYTTSVITENGKLYSCGNNNNSEIGLLFQKTYLIFENLKEIKKIKFKNAIFLDQIREINGNNYDNIFIKDSSDNLYICGNNEYVNRYRSNK